MGIQNLYNVLNAGSTVNAATSGAVTVPTNELYSNYTTNATGNITGTLGDGEYPGQLKIIELMTKDTSDLVVTVANMDQGNTLTFDASNEFALMVWGAAKWHIIYTNSTISTEA